MSKILVCGGRDYDNEEDMRETLSEYVGRDITIIHGGARGADALAGKIAKELGFKVIEVKAEWDKYGKRAGYLRNVSMADMNPDMVIAFPGGRGTRMMLEISARRGIYRLVINAHLWKKE